MNELALIIVIACLLVERYYTVLATAKQHKDLLRLIKAKSLEEVTQAELVDKVNPISENTVDPDLIPTDQLNEDQFDKMIKEQNGSN